jgi:hypothetical protein
VKLVQQVVQLWRYTMAASYNHLKTKHLVEMLSDPDYHVHHDQLARDIASKLLIGTGRKLEKRNAQVFNDGVSAENQASIIASVARPMAMEMINHLDKSEQTPTKKAEVLRLVLINKPEIYTSVVRDELRAIVGKPTYKRNLRLAGIVSDLETGHRRERHEDEQLRQQVEQQQAQRQNTSSTAGMLSQLTGGGHPGAEATVTDSGEHYYGSAASVRRHRLDADATGSQLPARRASAAAAPSSAWQSGAVAVNGGAQRFGLLASVRAHDIDAATTDKPVAQAARSSATVGSQTGDSDYGPLPTPDDVVALGVIEDDSEYGELPITLTP